MRNPGASLISILVIALLLPGASDARKRSLSTQRSEFEGVRRIELRTVSGSCVVEKGPSRKVEVEVVNEIEPRDGFDFVFDQDGEILELSEETRKGRSHGRVRWILRVPDGVEIEFSSASGDFSASGVSGRFKGSTASGDFEFVRCGGEYRVSTASGDNRCSDCTGRFRMSTASGDCILSNCTGSFEVSSASGDVDIRGIVVEDDCRFSSASGDVEVALAKTPKHDLSLVSASGKAVLDFDGNEIRGYVELTCKRRSGKIVSAVDFDEQVEYERNGDTYIRKSFTRGADEPEISVGTASGKAVLKK